MKSFQSLSIWKETMGEKEEGGTKTTKLLQGRD
jgi:hypothetical protein